MNSDNHFPTVPMIYRYRAGPGGDVIRRSTEKAVTEWLLFLCTPLGLSL